MRFQDKVALVTGAGSGLGRGTAIAFAREGASVLLLDIDEAGAAETAETISQSGGTAVTRRCDIASSDEVRQAVSFCIERFGRLDAAVNNAGVEQPFSPFHLTPDDEFDRVIGINLRGLWLCMKAELSVMLPQGSGAIVNIGSVADAVGTAGNAVYNASKHGVRGLTRCAALEYAQTGVRINAVSPAGMRTKMFIEAERAFPERVAEGVKAHPIGRVATIDEVAATVLFLASDDSGYILGQSLLVDGGYTVG